MHKVISDYLAVCMTNEDNLSALFAFNVMNYVLYIDFIRPLKLHTEVKDFKLVCVLHHVHL